MKAPHEQKYYGRYYAHMGITDELLEHADAETFANIRAIEAAIGEELKPIGEILCSGDDRITPEEYASMTLRVKHSRAHDNFEFGYWKKGEKRAHIKGDFNIAMFDWFCRMAETHPAWEGAEEHVARIGELIKEWRIEFLRIVKELRQRAGIANPSIMPDELMSRFKMLRDTETITRHLDAYLERRSVVDGKYRDAGEGTRPYWLERLVQTLAPEDFKFFAMLLGEAHGDEHGYLKSKLGSALGRMRHSLEIDAPELLENEEAPAPIFGAGNTSSESDYHAWLMAA